MKTIFDISQSGKQAYHSWTEISDESIEIEEGLLRTEPADLPEVSELDITRHYTALSQQNFSVDTNFYPLGSCTMKYNPRFNESFAAIFKKSHPLIKQSQLQEILKDFTEILKEISGYHSFTLQPAAGAHGELTGLLIIRKYHQRSGQFQRKNVLVPDSSHGTNPASAAVAGFEIVTIKSDEKGGVDLEDLKKHVDEQTAGLMLTNPNTLGVYDPNILEICNIVHQSGGLLYYDGANANALLGLIKPAELGFDIAHFNLHKTFSTPHGGGGPGSGPVGVTKELAAYLPTDGLEGQLESIGRVHSFYGNIAVILRAYAYVKLLGIKGLREVAQTAILNANYLKKKLSGHYQIPFAEYCLHEFVISAENFKKEHGVKAMDIAKRLIDLGIHPPTVYFPLIVKEALMIEPTETESKQTLDNFIEVMNLIADEARNNPEILKNAPQKTPVGRPDETRAAKTPIITANSN